MRINQAVVFTKPVHQLGVGLTSEQLDERVKRYFEGKGFRWVFHQTLSGTELAQRDSIKEHYLMYSRAACAKSAEDLGVTDVGKAHFNAEFGKAWETEVAAGRIVGTAQLLRDKGIDVQQLFERWNSIFSKGKTVKVQEGIIMAYLPELDTYCVNAFYSSMEANFYHPQTRVHYHVVEFDADQVSWKTFRKEVLGATNSSNALPESFRGQLYAEYSVEFPGRDNFVHGSAGPLEGLMERMIHEPSFEWSSNPIGAYLSDRGITLEQFKEWKLNQSISTLSVLFSATEEKNSDEIFQTLDKLSFLS